MKKVLLSLGFALSVSAMSAQVICDFETALGDGTDGNGPATIMLNGTTTATASIVANPAADDVNMSANCLKVNLNAYPTGAKTDAVLFKLPEGEMFKANDYAALKVNIYVSGGTSSAILKPRGKAGVWIDDATSPSPGTWIGIVKNRVDGEDGLAPNQSGWMQCYFDMSARTQTDDYTAIHIMADWSDERANNLEIYFDDFELVTEIPDNIPTSIGNELTKSTKIVNDNNLIKVNAEAAVNEICVYDMTGRVASQLKGEGLKQLNIGSLPAGLYIVKVNAGGTVFTEKVMKR